jgi:16S rRNA (cytosine967-C5)-methyltransferase
MQNLKFHRNLVHAVIDIVRETMSNQAYADRLIEKTLKSNKLWGARDRSFIAETSYDIIRNYRMLQFCSGNPEDLPSVLASYFILKSQELPKWDMFSKVNAEAVKAQYETAKNEFAIFNSYPDQLIEIVRNELPETYQQELSALNQEAHLVIRANTLLNSSEELASKLSQLNIVARRIHGNPDALILEKKFNVFQNELFQEGCFEIQDASSQLVAAFLQAEPGHRVIDACAGAGGKSLHLGCLMKNKGRIICLDTEAWKLMELKKRAIRNKIENIEIRHIENNKVIKRLQDSCDRLLLDVPCSGLGVLKRNPDAKWKINDELLNRVRETQKDLLHRYSMMVKPGGKMVYATCSILPSENSAQIDYFCREHRQFQLEEENHISPALSGFDGFYMARLRKN